MLQRVAANNSAGRSEDWLIEILGHLRQPIQYCRPENVATPCVRRREKSDQEQNDQQGAELDGAVGVEVLDAMGSAPAPVPHAGRP